LLPAGITVVAGSSGSIPVSQLGFGVNFFGDGGPANGALLASPFGVAVDSSGNVFVADTFNERIRMINQAGIINTVAGTGAPNFFGDGGPGAGAGLSLAKLLASGSNIVIGQSGSLYIADTTNGRIRRVDPTGTITTFADFTGSQYPGIRNPYHIARTPDGGLWAAEFGNGTIIKIGAAGAISTFAGTGSATPADGVAAASAVFGSINGLASDSAGNLYLLDGTTLRKIDATGILRTFAPGITSAVVATDPSGNVLVSSYPSAVQVKTIAPNGTVTTIPVPQASQITGLAADSAGNIYASDSGNHSQILKIASGGAVTVYAGDNQYGFGGDGGPAIQAALWGVTGLALDRTGNLYIADNDNDRIREVVVTGSFGASPIALGFTAVSNGISPFAQNVYLTSSIAGLAFTTSASAPWLSVTPSTGTIPSVLEVTVDPTTLAAGSYSGTITITAPNASPSTSTIAVTLSVSTPTPAALSVSTQNVSFTVTQGTTALTQQLQITDTGGGSLSFTAATSGASWLNISTSTGTATPSSPASLTITATPGSLSPGTYSGIIAITGAGATINVPVTLSITAPTAAILISQVGLTFTAVAQGGVPLPQTFGILNTGQGSMNWSATSSMISGGNWLAISPASGTVTMPYLDVSLVAATINPAGLSAGTYYGQIQVSATAANTPQLVTVILNVLPAGLSLGPQIYPTGLIFTGVAGVTPGSQDVQVGNPTATANSFQSGQIGTGFSFLPTNADIQPNQPADVRVYPDFTQLTPGSITKGTITLQFSDQSPSQTINVLFVVAPTGATANRTGAKDARWYRIDLSSAASGCASANLQVQYRSPALNFAAVQGQATPLEAQVTDGCGNLVGTSGGQPATVTTIFSDGEPSQTMTHIGNGVWQVGWKPVKTGLVVVTVAAFLPQSGVGLLAGDASLTGTVSSPSTSATPLVTAAGVVHSASDQSGVPISPGGLITVYGNNLADGAAQDNGLPLPDTLSGTQVRLGTQPLPILYTNTGQLNVQVPYGVPINTQYQLTVQHGSTLSVPQSLVVAPAQPGIFTVNQQGTGQGSIVKSDGVTLVQPGTPATAGDTIVIYCTGLGAVSPAVKEGSPAPTRPPLATTVNPVTVFIGGQTAAVAFSGLAPGFAGLYQLNVVVPSGITAGNAVPVVLSVAGRNSPPVTMAVQ